MEQQINFDPFDYPDWTCEKCGHNVFTPGVIFKKVPGIVLGQGTGDVPFPIKVATCQKCGALSSYDKQTFEEAEKLAKGKPTGGSETSVGLIL